MFPDLASGNTVNKWGKQLKSAEKINEITKDPGFNPYPNQTKKTT
jgi:hypothetical protein